MTNDLLTSPQRRLRAAAVGIVATLLILGTGVFLGVSRAQQRDQQAGAASQSSMPLAAVASQPRIVFRNSAIGTECGFVAMVPLSDPGGPRAFTTVSCDRVFATTNETLCLASERGVATT